MTMNADTTATALLEQALAATIRQMGLHPTAAQEINEIGTRQSTAIIHVGGRPFSITVTDEGE
jgi:hypothetical protein